MPQQRRTGRTNKNSTALSFYNEKLRDDPNLRSACEDRHILDETIDCWKDGKDIIGVSRSDIIYSLKIRWQLIDAKLIQDNVIVWKEAMNPEDKAIRIKETIKRITNSRLELESNSNGVTIDKFEFGTGEGNICNIGELVTQQIFISSDVDVNCEIKDSAARQRGITIEGESEFALLAGSPHSINVSFMPKMMGITKTIVVFDFSPIDIDGDNLTQPFSIARYISIRAGNPDDYKLLEPTAPYVKKSRDNPNKGKFSKPERMKSTGVMIPFVNPLGIYPIPNTLRATNKKEVRTDLNRIMRGENNDFSAEIEKNFDYSSCLTIENYTTTMQYLLWMEEGQMEVDIKSYDLNSNLTTEGGRYYKLLVPGLAENRPSVLKGDKIFIHVPGGLRFEGRVQRTTEEFAIIDLPKSFSRTYIGGLRVDVRFTFSRTTLRTSHQSLMEFKKESTLQDKIIFPQLLDIEENPPLPPLNTRIIRAPQLKFYNRTLNQEQQTAVVGIIQSVARPSPYLIYGPPGTGKTVTLVESILQTMNANGSDPDAKILICAPSNAATDVIVERLSAYVSPREMLRLNAYSRDKGTVPEDVMGYSKYNEEECSFHMPDMTTVKGYKVVAMTISSAGKLPNHGILDHFTHVFIDEAGHSIEAEAIACFVSVTKQDEHNPVVTVLAGDPKQLGPIIRSEVAKQFGLEKSLLERLTQREPYSRSDEADVLGNHFDKRMITKLVHNYRSHQKILELPNKAFYDGDLIAEADITRSHRFANWEHLPQKGFPIIFHGCEGEDMREANSPSWFNPDEAQYVKMYVDLLIKDTKRNRCTPEDIGIITPYHRQVQKIRKLLDAHGYSGCKVGSVEEFQGSERPVIIISTVRSTVEHIQFDQKHRLGFLANEKRFNVAITRAQALLILIGNPFTLENDPNWKSMIEHAIDGGGYTGVEYTRKEERNDSESAVEDLIFGFQSATLERGSSDDDDDFIFVEISHTAAQEGPAWRSEE